jgi:hypothetical protein
MTVLSLKLLIKSSVVSFFLLSVSEAICPLSKDYCIEIYEPVICKLEKTKEECHYSNICFAQSAGFTKEECIFKGISV